MVAVVALLVQVYSTAYLRGDPRYASYAAVVSLFTAAMLLVVVSADLLVLFVGWEVMGICSSLLIGHHWEQADARAGAVKAFVVTRVGDVAAAARRAAARAWTPARSRIPEVLAAGPVHRRPLLLAARRGRRQVRAVPAARVAARRHGRSDARLRAHPRRDHGRRRGLPGRAAVAGVRGLAGRRWPPSRRSARSRCSARPWWRCAQDDLKRVLAWSTVSQLGYHDRRPRRSAPTPPAVFHLLSHAAFKALLFLAAGSVMHAVGTTLMRDMGGLRRAMPVTFVTMTLGLAALAGLPPFAGFFSKEAVLAGAEDAALHAAGGRCSAAPGWAGWLVLVSGLVTVAVTGAYATRAWCLHVPRPTPPRGVGSARGAAGDALAAGGARGARPWASGSPGCPRAGSRPGSGPRSGHRAYAGVEPEALVAAPGPVPAVGGPGRRRVAGRLRRLAGRPVIRRCGWAALGRCWRPASGWTRSTSRSSYARRWPPPAPCAGRRQRRGHLRAGFRGGRAAARRRAAAHPERQPAGLPHRASRRRDLLAVGAVVLS